MEDFLVFIVPYKIVVPVGGCIHKEIKEAPTSLDAHTYCFFLLLETPTTRGVTFEYLGVGLELWVRLLMPLYTGQILLLLVAWMYTEARVKRMLQSLYVIDPTSIWA